MRIGIVFKDGNRRTQALAVEIKKYVEKSGSEVVSDDNLKSADCILSLGGDGTLIHKACEYIELGEPILGINTGNLGFLTAVEEVDWKLAVEHVLAGKIHVSERISLDISVGGDKFRAVNEAAIKGLYRVVELMVGVRGEEFLKVSGDGVIVATQSGSTAYSLSAGGPIVDPDLDSILVTPINPIGLPIPSVVLAPDEVVDIKVLKGEDVSLIIDGQEHRKISQGEVVRIGRGKYRVKLAYLDKQQFLKALNAKFGLTKRAVR